MIRKNLATVVVAAVLFGAGGAHAAGGVFPSNADEGSSVLQPLSTHADRHAVAPRTAQSAFPSNADEGRNVLPSRSTRVDDYRGPIIERMMAEMFENPAFPRPID